MSNVISNIKIVDNVFVKMMECPKAGNKIEGHAHNYDHITLLAKGKVIMRARGKEQIHIAPCLIVTPRGIVHEFEALEDNSLLCCIHAIREGDEVDDVVSPEVSEQEALELLHKFPLVKTFIR